MREGHSARRKFWESVLRIQREKMIPWIGVRNAIGVVLPLVIGLWQHAIPSGLVAATGALNVAFSDSHLPYVQRLRRMAAASAVVGCGVFVGALCGWSHGLTMAVSLVWAFAAGLLVAVDTRAGDLGAISLVTLVVYSAFPMTPAKAFSSGALAVCGGFLQTALSVALWPLRRYTQQRRVLAELFRGLAESALGRTVATEAPPASVQSTDAQDWLAALDRDGSLEAERYRALLSQGERIRLGLMTLARLRVRIEREARAVSALASIDRFFAIAGEVLRILADELFHETVSDSAGRLLEEARDLANQLRYCPDEMVQDARRQIDALAGQFRASLELAEHAMPAGAANFQRREAARSWRLRLQGTLAILRANLSLHSAACRHAIRLSICVALAEALGQTLGVARAYWAPMTAVIVLKPDFSATFSRGVQRLFGTFAGLLLATGLFHLMPTGSRLEITWIGVFTFVARGIGPANYGIAATAITALVVLLLSLNGAAPSSLVLPRGTHTAVGGALALAAYWLWPTWERTQLSETIAQLLEAYASYFRCLRVAYEDPGKPLPRDLDRLRLEGRRARSNLEASVERFGAEPGTEREHVGILGALLANSHRLAHAFMALEAGLNVRTTAPPRPAMLVFGDDVEATISTLASVLRGAKPDLASLPDLREDHDALLESDKPVGAKYALINVETDRIANSLNTLAEDIGRWVAKDMKPG